MANRVATVCVLTYGEYTPFFARCFESVLAHTPRDKIELRLGFNDADASFQHAWELLHPTEDTLRERALSDTLTHFAFRSADGLPVQVWKSQVNLYKEPMARLLYHGEPLETEYAVWFDDDSYVRADWWPELEPLLQSGVEYIGPHWWVDYLPGQTEMIRHQPWYREVSFDTRHGREGVWFVTGGFLAVRSECLRGQFSGRVGHLEGPDAPAVRRRHTAGRGRPPARLAAGQPFGGRVGQRRSPRPAPRTAARRDGPAIRLRR
jgi:hypothetical protein